MSRRDLHIPSLEQVLAVSPFRVRERRPPPAQVRVTLSGRLRWSLVDRRGREVRGGEQHNLITDQGLDQIASTVIFAQLHTASSLATYFPIMRYAAVGTDNTEPDPSDTALGNEIARTDTTFASDTAQRTAPGVWELTRSIEFDYEAAVGNLTEWAFSFQSTAGGIFNRELFRDDEGDPDVVTKTTDEKLRLIYTLEVALSPVTMTAASFDIANVGTVSGNYMLIGGAAASGTPRGIAPDVKLFNWLAGASFTGMQAASPGIGALHAIATDQSGATYASDVTPSTTTSPQTWTNTLEQPRDPYTPGSFTRTGGLWRFETNQGNLNPVRAFYILGASENAQGSVSSWHHAGYVFDLDGGSEFTKDNEHVLFIGLPTVSWGRGSS